MAGSDLMYTAIGGPFEISLWLFPCETLSFAWFKLLT
jgi:hypothetical protein